MQHAKAFGIKFIIVSIFIFSIFGIYGNVTLNLLFWMSLIVTVTMYVIGDVWLLPRIGNLKATLADFVLLFGIVGILGSIVVEPSAAIVLASFYVAFFITLVEPLFHGFMQEKVYEDDEAFEERPDLQTEFAEEADTDVNIDEIKNEQKEHD